MMILFWLVIIAICFYLLAQLTDAYFVPALEKIGDRFNFSKDMSGATLMAAGSSAPELAIAVIAVLGVSSGDASVGTGTIIGSALFNILVIIGVSAIVRQAVLAWQPVVRDNLFYLLSIVWLLISFWDGQIVWYEALVFVLLYALYLYAVLYWRRWFPYVEEHLEEDEVLLKNTYEAPKRWYEYLTHPLNHLLNIAFPQSMNYWYAFFMSIVLISVLSFVLVESAVSVAVILGIPPVIIALTVLAFGTSVPDLVASVVVARRGHGGMAISNAVGSNIINILLGLGLPWLIMLTLNPEKPIAVDSDSLMGSVALLFATIIATLFIYKMSRWKVGKKAGWLLVGAYIGYLTYAIWTI